jgi:hypothetical protein
MLLAMLAVMFGVSDFQHGGPGNSHFPQKPASQGMPFGYLIAARATRRFAGKVDFPEFGSSGYNQFRRHGFFVHVSISLRNFPSVRTGLPTNRRPGGTFVFNQIQLSSILLSAGKTESIQPYFSFLPNPFPLDATIYAPTHSDNLSALFFPFSLELMKT